MEVSEAQAEVWIVTKRMANLVSSNQMQLMRHGIDRVRVATAIKQAIGYAAKCPRTAHADMLELELRGLITSMIPWSDVFFSSNSNALARLLDSGVTVTNPRLGLVMAKALSVSGTTDGAFNTDGAGRHLDAVASKRGANRFMRASIVLHQLYDQFNSSVEKLLVVGRPSLLAVAYVYWFNEEKILQAFDVKSARWAVETYEYDNHSLKLAKNYGHDYVLEATFGQQMILFGDVELSHQWFAKFGEIIEPPRFGGLAPAHVLVRVKHLKDLGCLAAPPRRPTRTSTGPSSLNIPRRRDVLCSAFTLSADPNLSLQLNPDSAYTCR